MMMHDYGFYQFEKYENFLDFKQEREENKGLKGKTSPIEKFFGGEDAPEITDTKYKETPLFETREQLLIYDECY